MDKSIVKKQGEILALLKRHDRLLQLMAFNQIIMSDELTELEKDKIINRLEKELSKLE